MTTPVPPPTVPPPSAPPLSLEEYATKQLSTFEALRRLGFPADDIYVSFYNDGELFTELHQGEKRFLITISNGNKIDPKTYVPVWEQKCEMWNTTMTHEERLEVWLKGYPVAADLFPLVYTLKLRGFDMPKVSFLNQPLPPRPPRGKGDA